MNDWQAQLKDAVYREDYGDAAKLHRAISAANADDVVGTAIRLLNVPIDRFIRTFQVVFVYSQLYRGF